MKPISQKTLRDANWQLVYTYAGDNMQFTTYACSALPGLTVTHTKYRSRLKSQASYAINGVRTDSPIQAVRIWNAQAKERSRRQAAAGPEPVGPAQ